jgi:hypothetical protein
VSSLETANPVIEIRSSESEWILKLSQAYKDRVPVIFVDDAVTGFDPRNDTIFSFGQRSGFTRTDWEKVLGCLGVSVVGIVLIVLAMIDPEPTSKLAILVAGGVILACTGGAAALFVVTGLKPPTVKVHAGAGQKFEMSWT